MQAEAVRQQVVLEASDRDSEMKAALAAVGGDQRTLISEHELRVCGLRTKIFEAKGARKRMNSELNDSTTNSLRLAQLDGRVAEADRSLRESEEARTHYALELRASEEQKFRQVESLTAKLMKAEAEAAAAPSTSELAVQASRFEAEKLRWQINAEEMHHSEDNYRKERLVFQLVEQLREMTESVNWYRSMIPHAVLRTCEPEDEQ